MTSVKHWRRFRLPGRHYNDTFGSPDAVIPEKTADDLYLDYDKDSQAFGENSGIIGVGVIE